MLRVGLLAPELTEAHGWGRYTIDLAQALVAQGDIELVIAASESSPDDGGIPNRGYHPFLPSLMPARRWITPRSLLAVPRLMAAFRGCDVIHTAAEHYLPAAMLASLGRPVFVTAHGTYLPRGLTRHGVGPLFRWATSRATVLPVSTYTEAQIKAVYPAARTRVVFNGVHVERFAARPASLPQTQGPTVLGVGVNKERKGFHVLLEAIAQVRVEVPDVQCVIVGNNSDTPYQERLRGIIEAYDLGELVQLLGRVSEETLFGWYHAADVFALPSVNVDGKFEGFGLVYLEAGATGLPVIGTLDCGAEDAIDDGQTGYLVPQNDPSALAEKLAQLLHDPDLRARMGAAGRAKADANSWTRIAAQVREAYDHSLT